MGKVERGADQGMGTMGASHRTVAPRTSAAEYPFQTRHDTPEPLNLNPEFCTLRVHLRTGYSSPEYSGYTRHSWQVRYGNLPYPPLCISHCSDTAASCRGARRDAARRTSCDTLKLKLGACGRGGPPAANGLRPLVRRMTASSCLMPSTSATHLRCSSLRPAGA